MSEEKKKLFNPLIAIKDDKEGDKILNTISNVNQKVESEPIVQEKRKNPEDRHYLVIYYAREDDTSKETIKSFEICVGRTNTYEFIKGMVEYMDIHESRVLVETVALKDSITVYQFMKTIQQYYDETFDIENYNFGDDSEYGEE